MQREVGQHLRIDIELAVGEMLEQHCTNERLVGRADLDGRDPVQPRLEVGQRKSHRLGALSAVIRT